jgi:hypothetical protein
MIARWPIIVALVASGVAAQGVGAQQAPPAGEAAALARQIEARFDVLPLTDGLALRPRFASPGRDVRSIEIAAGTIAIDGAPVTGAELRDRVGPDADLIVKLSYLDQATQRSLFEPPGAPPGDPPLAAPGPPPAPDAPPGARPLPPPALPDTPRRPERTRRYSGDRVRLGGGVTVGADELVTGDVVAIGGSARVLGEVRGEVVAVGGSVELGPNAIVSRDVVVVGGALRRDPSSTVGGSIHEVGLGSLDMSGWRWSRAPFENWWWGWTLGSAFALFSTLTRVAVLCLLAALVVLVGREQVERIGVVAAAEPLKSGAVGVLSQLLFLPVLIMTIVILVLTIIGIPLLVLVPFLVIGLLLVALVGFTSIGHYMGRIFGRRMGWAELGPYAATIVGILLIVSPLILARLLGLAGGLLFPMTFGLRLIATVVEYAAWTVGFGAVALLWFNRRRGAPLPAVP